MKPLRLITLAMVLITCGCVQTIPNNPSKISEKQFHGKIKTIVLAPVTVPENFENAEEVKSKFESLIDAKLRQQGFIVIPSSEVMAIWKRIAEQMGGYFDPTTGKPDEEKKKIVISQTFREAHAKFKADAVLHPGIRIITAPFIQNTARWDGASEELRTGSQFLNAFLYPQRDGSISALSLHVTIEDQGETELYCNQGGIQVLSKMSGFEFVSVPKQELLTNNERNAAAVNIALDPLVRNSASGESKTMNR
jgi:hypothetical protein